MKILIAEDDPISRRLLESQLIKWNYEVVITSDGKAALEALQSEDPPSIAILDWMMPEMDGVKVCQEIRKQENEHYTYVLLLTAKDRKEDLIEGLEAGADDYVIKPFNAHELDMRIKAGKRIIELEKKLRMLTIKDELTNLYNRRGLIELSKRQMKIAKRQKIPVSLLFADIDDFKIINDTFGHKEGDSILIETARILNETYRETDIITRIGGDEFAVLLMGASENDIDVIKNRLQENIDSSNKRNNKHKLSLSIGIATSHPELINDIEHLLTRADKLMYEQKNSKKMSLL
jgi:diguanylate cyclase (GGDEF)-like protein